MPELFRRIQEAPLCSPDEYRELTDFVNLASNLLEHLQSGRSPAPYVPEGHKRAIIGLLADWNEAAVCALVAHDKEKRTGRSAVK